MRLEKKFGAVEKWFPSCIPIQTYRMFLPYSQKKQQPQLQVGRTGQSSLQILIEIFLIKRTFKRIERGANGQQEDSLK